MYQIYNYNSGQLSVSKRYQRTPILKTVRNMLNTAIVYENIIASIVVTIAFAYYGII